jgi:hypothetical protein
MPAALTTFAKYVRPEVAGCPEIVILDAIKRAGIEFCKRTRAIRQSVTLTTVADQARYTLATETGTKPEEVLAVKRDGADNLNPSSFADFTNYHMDRETGTPNFYYLDGNQLVLGNIPEGEEELEVIVRIRPTEDATTLPDELAERYLMEIAAGAKAYLMSQRNKTWTDIEGAAINNATFNKAISNANLRAAKGGASKPLRTKSQFF